MGKRIVMACFAAATLAWPAFAQSQASSAIRKAADALGGVDRINSAKSLEIRGYGQDALQDGGGNQSASPDAPQRWDNILSYQETIDLVNHRIRVEQRTQSWLPAATLSRVIGNILVTNVLDGDVPYTVTAQGTDRRASANTGDNLRVEMETHPVALIRMALEHPSSVSNSRAQGDLQVVDIHPEQGPPLHLAMDRKTGLPIWVKWMENDGVLRDLTFQKWFTGFEPINGVMMPTGFKTVIDFRNIVEKQIYVMHNEVDGPIGILAAPDAVKSAAVPVRKIPAVEVTPVAQGIWLLHGSSHNSILIEFSDHLALFEVPLSEEWTHAVIEKARSVVPGKPLTEAIVSHHHFDHSGGIREAVAEGLTIIAHRGTEGIFREIVARKSTIEPDELSQHPKPLKFMPVDDHLVLKDASMEIDLYHIIGNEHMAEALMAWEPKDRLLIEGDLFDNTWQNYPWGNNYADNVKLRSLDVDKDVPVHGEVMSWNDVQQSIQAKIATTLQLCKGPQSPLLPECEVMR